LGTLYTNYRNGFVHEFAPGAEGWCREEERVYWCDKYDGQRSINVEHLAHGFVAALDEFEREFRAAAATNAGLYSRFFTWLHQRLAEPVDGGGCATT
ncbi:MAG TPA: hypothetical protein VMQ62_15065, partial [Dongiaceae bacterium]|nr:hypothetical protein [Dongiaceae bacterium]